MLCARTPKLAERGLKNTAGGSVWRARSGVPIDLSTSDVYFFCLSSTRHRKVVRNPQATEGEREVVVKPNTAGGSVGLARCRHQKVVQNPHCPS